jgi:tetratricopeptide (TPR) repeat protein
LDQNASIKRKAQDLIKKGAYADATAHYEKLAEAGDLQSYDYVVLGDLLIRCGRRVEAVERYREALNSYAEAGLSRNAIALAKKVHRLAPKLYFVHRRLGDLYLAEGLEGEACRHYTEYLDRVDREAEGIQDELQHVCEQLLEIDLPSISIVERVVAVARDAGFGDAIAGGILGQAQRALARGDADSHTKLQGLARELSPRGGGQETPPAHPALPANALFDPSAVDFPEEPAEQPAVLSLEGFTFDALHSVNLDPPTPVAAFESDDADAAFESDETDAAIDGSTPVFSLDEVSDIPVDADRPAEMEPRASEPGMSVAEDVEIVLEHDDDPDNLRTRAMEFLEKGDIARAQRELVRAARAYFQGGRSREAEELYRKVMHLDPNHLDALRGLVELAYINGERGKMAHWGTELGDVLLAREMYADAKIQFERVLAFDPDNVKARARVNRLNTIAGVNDANFGELVPDAGEVQGAQVTVKDEPTGTQTAFDLSRILDEFKTAMTDQIEVDDGKSHFDLGLTYKEMGLLPEAVSEFEQAAAAEADRSRSLEMLGECYLLLDRHEESLRVLSEIVDAADGDGQARVHMQLGRAYEGMGAWDQAEEEYYRALELDENLEEAVERLERLEERRERGVA